MQNVNMPTLARMSLEMNFVNHILPSGGASGISYMGWRLGHYGVSQSRAAMAQAVRFAMGFIAYIVLMEVAVLIVTIDTGVNRWVILASSVLATSMVIVIVAGMYLLNSKGRIVAFTKWLEKTINILIKKVTFGRAKRLVSHITIEQFFLELHDDYQEILDDKKVLIKPLIWGTVFTITEVFLFWVTFVALGITVNPAPILIAYGVAATAGFFVITPGGAGAYEAIMIAFLAIAGVDKGTAIAGIVLTRVILLLGTITLGYFFYQHALIKYGKK
jgi:putative heme transporter